MAITNGYCTLTEIKAALVIGDTNDDTQLEAAVEAASRDIDRVCHQRFWLAGSATARTYVIEPLPPFQVAPELVWIHPFDPGTAPVIKTDDDGDGTFETTWTSGTDYQLEPLVYDDIEPGPQFKIRAVGSRSFPARSPVGSFSPSQAGRRAQLQVTAKWGWPAVPAAIKKACLLHAEDLFKAKDAPFGVAGSSDLGVLRIRENMLVSQLIEPYVLPEGVG